MARRRSARLASLTKTPGKSSVAEPSLSSLVEREESPENAVTQSLDAMVSSPSVSAVPRTPAASSPYKPPLSEMHPSKVHPTTGIPSSGLRLGFVDIKPAVRPNIHLPPAAQATPSKIALPPSSPFTFRFNREPTSQTPSATAPATGTLTTSTSTSDLKLGKEAQAMMDTLRAEAAKIKAELAAKREAERLHEEQEAEELGGRRIAKAKGRAGRFSAVHMAEFKKMDSIENHPSAFRANLTRTTPLAAAGIKRSPSKPNLQDSAEPTPVHGIKRTQSKANLHEPEPGNTLRKGIKRSQSKANLDNSDASRAGPSAAMPSPMKPEVRRVRADEAAAPSPSSPAKRARQLVTDDASTNRPVSRDGASLLPRPKSSGKDVGGIPRTKSSLASLMTPTKSSIARAASVKTPVHGSMIKSPSKPVMLGSLTHSITSGNFNTMDKSGKIPMAGQPKQTDVDMDAEMETMVMPTKIKLTREIRTPSSRLDKVKAMFRSHKTENTTKTKSNIPLPSTISKALGPVAPSLNKDLPDLPTTITPGRTLLKRVAFTPEAARASIAQNSPSPIKSCIPRSMSKGKNVGEVFYPALDSMIMNDENKKPSPETEDEAEATMMLDDQLLYPNLSSKRPLPQPPIKHFNAAASSSSASTAEPSAFTFRADHTINFSSAAASPNGFGNSPGQAGVRRVRPSSMAMPMPGTFPTSGNDLFSSTDQNHQQQDKDSSLAAFRASLMGSSSSTTKQRTEMAKPALFSSTSRRRGSNNFLLPDGQTHTHVTRSPIFPAVPHGFSNKKRHRVSTDEEEAEVEAAARAAKKRRQEVVPEGDALVAPRLVAGGVGASGKKKLLATPGKQLRGFGGAVGGSASPAKKKAMLSVSRLQMLARPKMRK